MKVLQVHAHYRQHGGEDVAVATEATLLRGAGHDVVSFMAANPVERGRATLDMAMAVWNQPAARRMEEAARRLQPDVAHVHNTWFSLSPSVLAALHQLGIPVVMTLHNYRLVCAAATLFRDGAPCQDCVGTHPWHAVAHRCYRSSIVPSTVAAMSIALHHARGTWQQNVDRFLSLTEFGRQQFIDGGLPPERISVKSNSVADIGPRQDPPSASNTVVFIGRLAEEKGVAPLLDAWRSMPAPFELAIVGEGPLEESLRNEAPARVRFLGQRSPETIAALLLKARALVFPSIWYEGQGLVALEAAAAGLPVLLSDHGAMSELFAPGAEELLFEAGAVQAMASRLRQLEDDTFVDTFGAHTRRRFEERYTHGVAVHRLEQIYREVQR